MKSSSNDDLPPLLILTNSFSHDLFFKHKHLHLYSALKNKRDLTYDERYWLGYLEGYRIGKISVNREILIRCLHIEGKKENLKPSKALIQKINREIDIAFLTKVLLTVSGGKMSLKELEIYYDMFFCAPDKSKTVNIVTMNEVI